MRIYQSTQFPQFQILQQQQQQQPPPAQQIQSCAASIKEPDEYPSSYKAIDANITPNSVFVDYDHFQLELKAYIEKTHQLFTTFNSQKNDSIKHPYKFLHLRCKYYKAVDKIKSKGYGKRPCQKYHAKNCPAEIRICLKKFNIYEVVKFNDQHSHEVTRDEFKMDPKNRKLTDDLAQEVIKSPTLGEAPRIESENDIFMLPTDLKSINDKFKKLEYEKIENERIQTRVRDKLSSLAEKITLSSLIPQLWHPNNQIEEET
jgi:hypothetical protein